MTREPHPQVQLIQENCGELGCIAWMKISWPGKLNILNRGQMERMLFAAEKAREIEDLRALILMGEGERAFIGGADVREMATLNPAGAREFISRLHRVCAALRAMEVPVIAGIGGYCLGAGLEVAAACDIRVASADALFGMPEVKVGIPSVIEAALLPRLIGWGKTCEMLMTGETYTAQEAAAMGFVQRLAPEGELEGAVETLVHEILKNGERAIRLQKALMRQWERLPLDQAIERGVDCFEEAFRSDEPRTRMGEFLERKRKAGGAAS